MKQLTLSTAVRGTGKKGRSELSDRQVPGVVYGREFKSTPVAADLVKLTKLYQEAGYNRIVQLDIDGDKQDILFKEIQLDPLSSDISHFDLYAIVKGEKIKAEVPVEAIGESPAVILGANLAVNVESVEVECVPSKLPDRFELDVSAIKEIGDTLHIYDIVVADEDVMILDDPETTVFKAEEIREMVVEEEEPEEVEGEEGEEAEGEEGEDQPEGEEKSSESDDSEDK